MPERCSKCGSGMYEEFSRSVDADGNPERYWVCPLDPKDCRIKELESKLAASEAQVKALTAERDGLLKAKLWRDHWPSGDLLELAREEHKTNEALKAHWVASYQGRQDSENGRAIAQAHLKALERLRDALFVAVHEERENFDRAALKLGGEK